MTTQPPCDQWTPGPGGAHPWCNTCGWRIDHHPDAPEPLAGRYRARWAT